MSIASIDSLTDAYGDYQATYLGKPCSVKAGTSEENLLNEDFFLRYLHKNPEVSPFIVERFAIQENPLTQKTNLITELTENSLSNYLKDYPLGLSLDRTREITRQITLALNFIDQLRVVYPNLALEDIFLSPDGSTVKLANFEAAYFKDLPNITETPKTESTIENLAYVIVKMFSSAIFSKSDLSDSPLRHEMIKSSALSKEESPEKINLLHDLFRKIFDDKTLTTYLELLSHPFLTGLVEEQASTSTPAKIAQEPKIEFLYQQAPLPLGGGAFATVYKTCIKENGVLQGTYAFKISRPDQNDDNAIRNAMQNEAKMLRLILTNSEADPFIVMMFATERTKKNEIALILELMGTDLYKYLQTQPRGLSLDKERDFTRQLCRGLLVLFKLGIIHLDIKLSNILVSKDARTIKIADFGSACFIDKPCLPSTLYVQTRWYRSPEIALKVGFSQANDIWSLGVVVVEMVTRKILFPSNSVQELMAFHQSRLNKPYPPDFVAQGNPDGQREFKDSAKIAISKTPLSELLNDIYVKKAVAPLEADQCSDFVMRCLEYVPENRATPAQLLEHSFLSSIS